MGVLPALVQMPAQYHGALMAVGFLAALIAAERAISLTNVLMAVASIYFSSGGLLLAVGFKLLTDVLWMGGALAFMIWTIWMWLKFRGNFSNLFFTFAAVLLLVGVVFFILGFPRVSYGLAWAGFFAAFIVGERMDMLKITKASALSYVIAGLSLPVAAAGSLFLSKNLMAAMFGLLLYSAVRHDVALRFVMRPGFSRYLAIGLGTAYLWLAVSTVLWSLAASLDIILHSIFLGFVGTMVFTHAPIILPAILKIKHIYSPSLYIPFTMLQASTAMRIFSAATLNVGLWSLSGLVTVLSVIVFILLGVVKSFQRKTIYTK
ncbi:MAG: hypothetical protein QXT61_05300 [Candidatus Caldarchaeum sp.]